MNYLLTSHGPLSLNIILHRFLGPFVMFVYRFSGFWKSPIRKLFALTVEFIKQCSIYWPANLAIETHYSLLYRSSWADGKQEKWANSLDPEPAERLQ